VGGVSKKNILISNVAEQNILISNCFIKFIFCLTVFFVEGTRVYIRPFNLQGCYGFLFRSEGEVDKTVTSCQMYTLVSSTNKTVKTEGELDKTVTSCQMYTLVSSTNKTVRQKVNLIKQLLVVKQLVTVLSSSSSV
jgi:hypothetical protein